MLSEYALISRAPLEAVVGGVRVPLPHRPAAVWAQGVGHIGSLLAELADPDVRDMLADVVMTHPQGVDDLRRESFRLLSEATGRQWWEAARLIATAASPQVLGRLVLAGVDPWSRTVGEWVAATYSLCIKGADEKGRMRFELSLSVPPAGYEDAWDDEGDDAEATLAAVSAMMGGK